LYSATVLVVQHHVFPGTSAFVRVYLGDPPWSQVSLALVTTRLLGWGWLHCAVIFPAVAAVAWSLRTNNPYIVTAYVACIPWALLHLLAVSDLAGLMFGYYSYPFLIAMAWPWMAVLIHRRLSPAAPSRPIAAPAQLLGTVALSLLPVGGVFDPGRITFPEAFFHAPSATQQALTDRVLAAIDSGRPVLGRLMVDASVAALRPRAFAHNELAGWADGPADTVVFLEDGYDSERLRSLPGLPVHLAVPGTAIRIMTDRPESVLRVIGITP
jgi:hypothetical protein